MMSEDLNRTKLDPDEWFQSAASGFRQSVNGMDRHMGDKGNELEHRKNGVASELAYATMLDKRDKREKRYTPRVFAPDGGWDICTSKGNKVDVKITVYEEGRLLCDRKEDHRGQEIVPKADAFALLTFSNGIFTNRGWAWKEDLIDKKNFKPLTTKKDSKMVYQLNQSQLRQGFPP
jgi:hypothetical protein|tara:strand:+ start:538 stop:1065 length:528 start_codon:yes stop_codon:yes gene_type:complete